MAEKKIKAELDRVMKNTDDIIYDMSAFYTKMNKVIGKLKHYIIWAFKHLKKS